MKKMLILIAAIAVSQAADARGGGHSRGGHSSHSSGDHSVRGYVTKKGTYVAPHHQTNSDGTVRDNYSHKGNYNPYTGKTGDRYDRSSPSSEYYDGSPSR